MENSDKIQILLSLLNIRQENLKNMREWALKIFFTSASIFLILIGWAIQSNSDFKSSELLFLIFMVFIYLIANLITIYELKKRFIYAHKDIISIEKCLKLYEPNIFTDDGKPLYPKVWQKVSKGKYFSLYSILLSIMALTVIIILTIH